MNQIPKCTLVPTRFIDEKDPRCFLSEVATISENDQIETLEVQEYDATLVYVNTDDGVPELYKVLKALSKCSEYNKILASYVNGFLHLAIAQGDSLVFSNVFPASDFTTAEYFLFAALKNLQINPEVSTVSFGSRLEQEDEMSLYTYFNSVEQLTL